MTVYTPDSRWIAPTILVAKKSYLWLCNHALAHLSSFTNGDFAAIVDYYYHYSEQTGLDALLALAQCVHETGGVTSWWSQKPRRNFAGIGVSGRVSIERPDDVENWVFDETAEIWKKGCVFGSVKEDVRKQIGRLLVYALTDAHANEAQRKLIDEALSHRGLPTHFRGAAPTIKGLAGRWAEDPAYATKLVKTANMLVSYQPKK